MHLCIIPRNYRGTLQTLEALKKSSEDVMKQMHQYFVGSANEREDVCCGYTYIYYRYYKLYIHMHIYSVCV